jgi:beta-glucosidase
MNIKNMIEKMTLDEKISLLSSKGGQLLSYEIPHLGIAEIKFLDGPHGLRLENQEKAPTCFPTACAMSATWNLELVEKIGVALANECKYFDIDILFGPGTNIKRTPICGRNFEYFSEDPYLAGMLSIAYIQGMQNEGIGVSLKHFTANNQEFERRFVSSEIDIRALREIFFKPFEMAVKLAKPWTVMCAYNRLNGIYCSENEYLLHTVLRDEWGFDGAIVSDYGAVYNRAKALKATVDWEMPQGKESHLQIKQSLEDGIITMEDIDFGIENMLKLVDKVEKSRQTRIKNCDFEKHHQLAKEVASEAITLFKNDNGILPITKEKYKKIAVVGQFAKTPVIQASSSAYVYSDHIDVPLDEIKKIANEEIDIRFTEAFFTHSHTLAGSDIAVQGLYEAMRSVTECDLTILFTGNYYKLDGGEGRDRQTMKLQKNMEDIILRLAKQNPNIVVVVQAGSVIDMSNWIDKVKAVVFTWYAGEAVGSAIADILFGITCPSGKTAESFPLRLEDNPTYPYYPGNGFSSWYGEGLMVGYRYYDTYEKDVLFPFGYGMSYTTFEYSDIKISAQEISEDETVTISFKLKNSGTMRGKEICQLYVKEKCSKVVRPEKELKAFTKVDLLPGEEKNVELILDKEAFSYFNVNLNKWFLETGKFKIMVGSSSRDIRLETEVYIKGNRNYT